MLNKLIIGLTVLTLISVANLLNAKPSTKPTSNTYKKVFEVINDTKIQFFEKEYEEAVNAIPQSINIFSNLNSYRSKVNFFSYIIYKDKTNEKPLSTYNGNYAGYSLEFYKDFSNEVKDTSIKYRVPVNIAKVDTHYFILFDFKIDAKNARNYWIYEPSTDEIVQREYHAEQWFFYTNNVISIVDADNNVKSTLELGKLESSHIH